jgi:hypothetical protein
MDSLAVLIAQLNKLDNVKVLNNVVVMKDYYG